MPSELDDRFDEAIARIVGPGGILEVTKDAQGRVILASAPATLPAFFDHFCARHGETEAIVMGADRTSFVALAALADRVARTLVSRFGIAKGDRVAIAMRNAPAWIASYMAVLKAGGVAVLVNGWWQAEEMRHGIALTEPKLIIADPERAARIAAAGCDIALVALPIELPLAEAMAPLLEESEAAAKLPKVLPEDDATILFTSGSTGVSKGAVSTHRAVTTGAYDFLTYTATLFELLKDGGIPANYRAATLVVVPLFHVTGAVPVMLNSFAIGRKMVLMRKWDASEALRLIEAERITYFVGVPTMSFELMQHPDRDKHDVSTLMDIVAGGAARPAAHVEPLAAAFPQGHPMIGYGLTETNAVGCTNFRENYRAKPTSTGRPQKPFVELALLASDGTHLAQGEIGEIGIRSAANFRGYWNNPEATAVSVTTDGYFRTGDIGYLDQDDYLFIVDRAKDIIIRGGENISCQEVEAAFYAHPAVVEASVFGLPDERLGEVPGAVVRLTEGTRIDGAALSGFVGARLARFKLPTRIWIEREPLPKLGTGKIDKSALRAKYRGV
jgi:long-chain acyl-CoA synthetase